MCFGAFDGLHPGHLDFFKQAKRLGDYLIVSVATDNNVEKIKGKKPLFTEEERLELISNLKIADKAVLGSKHDFYIQIKQLKPDIVCLGYDQWATEDEVLENVRRVGLLDTEVTRLDSYKPEKAKSTILKKKSADF